MKGSSAVLSSDAPAPLSFICLSSINYLGIAIASYDGKCREKGPKRVAWLPGRRAGEAHDLSF
jgi:hypothetical protein